VLGSGLSPSKKRERNVRESVQWPKKRKGHRRGAQGLRESGPYIRMPLQKKFKGESWNVVKDPGDLKKVGEEPLPENSGGGGVQLADQGRPPKGYRTAAREDRE